MSNVSSTSNKLTFMHDGIAYRAEPRKLSQVSVKDNRFELTLSSIEGGWSMGLFDINLENEPELGVLIMEMIANNFGVENVEDAEGKIALFLMYPNGDIAGITSANDYFYKVPVLRSYFPAIV